jgi:alanine racemase/UDP-N-acetylmuramoyl-tripeptide--D-alanyl-D-alanine ligase
MDVLAQFFEPADIPMIGVAHLEEALKLRASGIQKKIFIIHATKREAKECALLNFSVGVSDLDTIKAFQDFAPDVGLHLHVDTGMGRLGLSIADALILKKIPFEGVFSHLACAEDPSFDFFTHDQYQKFQSVSKHFDTSWVHLANSSGHLRFNFKGCNLSRVGLALFGETLTEECQTISLQKALRLTTHIISLQKLSKGESVGYSRSFINLTGEKIIATCPFGYHDGLTANYKGDVIIKGKKAPIVGKICMDFFMVDVTEIVDVAIGDEVEIFGQHQSLLEVARSANCSPHEILATIGPRVRRCYTE